MLLLLIVALLGTGVSAVAPCACLCGIVVTAESRPESPAERARMEYDRADGVFVGRVIASWTDHAQGRSHYTFAVRQSWKGVDDDTAHVAVPVSMGCEPVYSQGRSYLVLAARTPDGYRPPSCTSAIHADSAALGVYASILQEPRRSFPADTVRSIEALVPSAAEPSVPGPTSALVRVVRGDGRAPTAAGVRVSVVGTPVGGTSDAHGSVTLRGLEPRWYRFRFEFPDGEVHEEYGFPRCSDGTGTCSYASLTFVVGQDDVPALSPQLPRG
jgi:hypothetical protein